MRNLGNIRVLRVVLVGAPNVGKSALFNRLTGRYVAVSNYPGTTVEVARGQSTLDGCAAEIIDTPGMHSLLPCAEDERVASRMLIEGAGDVVVHTIDAKNISRMLPMTLQLLELGRPLVIALNMMDEADRLGVRIAWQQLGRRLDVPVIPIVAVTGRGIAELRTAIARAGREGGRVALPPVYANGVGAALSTLRKRIVGDYPVDRAAVAALLLQGDADVAAMLARAEPDGGKAALVAARELAASFDAPAPYRVAVERQRTADALLQDLVSALPSASSAQRRISTRDRLGRALIRPITGVPALLLVLFVGLYLFVGRFGGGTLVDWLEGTLFGRWVTPLVTKLFAGVSNDAVRALFVGDYGLLTLGLRYAIAIILPIVGAFFLFFSVLEDSGYFPRLALLVDRVFKRLGLSGRAVIPIVLGFACDTMATMVTRTLETRRERVLATLLLALAIPCSAQLGVILALMAGQPLVIGVWVLAVLGTFALVGWLGAKVLSGPTPTFYMELPPLRMPRLSNILVKTTTRMQWYFLEVLPLFLLASVLLWMADRTGVLTAMQQALGPVVAALGLPVQTAGMFIFGFFRRDYGAAGLYDLSRQGLLSPVQLAVAGVTLTLFVPCIAQFLMMVRERGVKTAAGMLVFITLFAFGTGFLLNIALGWIW